MGQFAWSAYKRCTAVKLVFQIGAANRNRGHRPASPIAVFEMDRVFPAGNGVSSGRLNACAPSLLFPRKMDIWLEMNRDEFAHRLWPFHEAVSGAAGWKWFTERALRRDLDRLQ